MKQKSRTVLAKAKYDGQSRQAAKINGFGSLKTTVDGDEEVR